MMRAKQMQLNNGIILASRLLCQQIGIEYPEEGLVLDTASFASNPSMPTVSNDGFIRPEHQLLQLQVKNHLNVQLPVLWIVASLIVTQKHSSFFARKCAILE